MNRARPSQLVPGNTLYLNQRIVERDSAGNCTRCDDVPADEASGVVLGITREVEHTSVFNGYDHYTRDTFTTYHACVKASHGRLVNIVLMADDIVHVA